VVHKSGRKAEVKEESLYPANNDWPKEEPRDTMTNLLSEEKAAKIGTRNQRQKPSFSNNKTSTKLV
jgi:hypothetical protein